jgi:hypothetical protein
VFRPGIVAVHSSTLVRLLAITGALLCTAVAAAGAATPGPAGPRLAFMTVGGPRHTSKLLTVGANGEAPRVIARESGGFGRISSYQHPNWSPDGGELAFFGPGDETSAVYVIGADGSEPHLLAGSEHPGGPRDATLSEPLYDPATGDIIVAVLKNGESIFGTERAQAAGRMRIWEEFWALPTDGSKPRRLSGWTLRGKHAYILYPYSIAPSGMVVATMLGRRGFNIAVVDPHGGRIRTLIKPTTENEGGLEPAISPDGKEIVYRLDTMKHDSHGAPEGLIRTDLMMIPTSGGRPKLLARVKGGARWPSWDPSGSRIAFTALKAGGNPYADGGPQAGSALMEVNADGSCLHKVYALRDGVVWGAAWQPGPDRGAAPISC